MIFKGKDSVDSSFLSYAVASLKVSDKQKKVKGIRFMDLLYCVGIGYLFGNFITAEMVGRIHNKSLFEHGSGNPGMTNTLHVLGKGPAALVLGGDILKTILAVVLCRWLFPSQGAMPALYAGAGVMLGHCFPFWHHFEGGKGVAVLCSAYILFAPIYGIIALACGGITLLLKKGVKVAAAVIPTVFCVLIALFQFSWVSLIPSLLMGGLEAYLNLRPNKLIDGKVNEAALSSSKSAFTSQKDLETKTEAPVCAETEILEIKTEEPSTLQKQIEKAQTSRNRQAAH